MRRANGLFGGACAMTLPDVNVLVHEHNADSPVHDGARDWWDECLSGPEGVGLAWPTLLGSRATVGEPVQDLD
jgi:hypothetical protein